MDFINKGLSGILNVLFYGVIFFLVIYLLFNIVPIILVFLAVAWIVVKGIKKIGKWNKSREVEDDIEIIRDNSPEDISSREVIDVDYREVR